MQLVTSTEIFAPNESNETIQLVVKDGLEVRIVATAVAGGNFGLESIVCLDANDGADGIDFGGESGGTVPRGNSDVSIICIEQVVN